MSRGSPSLLTKPMHPKSTKKSATTSCQRDTAIGQEDDDRGEEKIREILGASSETGGSPYGKRSVCEAWGKGRRGNRKGWESPRTRGYESEIYNSVGLKCLTGD